MYAVILLVVVALYVIISLADDVHYAIATHVNVFSIALQLGVALHVEFQFVAEPYLLFHQ